MALSAVIAGRVIQSQRAAREGRQRRISAAADNCQSTEALFNDLLQRAEGAELSKAQMSAGQLTTLHSGSAPMRSALDLGDELAVRTLADLDPLTLTSTCCSDGTPLMYLRTNPGHPHIKKLLPLLENLLLKEGFVPFSDGSAIPVDLLLAAISERREDLLKERVRSGIIDYRQFKVRFRVGRGCSLAPSSSHLLSIHRILPSFPPSQHIADIEGSPVPPRGLRTDRRVPLLPDQSCHPKNGTETLWLPP